MRETLRRRWHVSDPGACPPHLMAMTAAVLQDGIDGTEGRWIAAGGDRGCEEDRAEKRDETPLHAASVSRCRGEEDQQGHVFLDFEKRVFFRGLHVQE